MTVTFSVEDADAAVVISWSLWCKRGIGSILSLAEYVWRFVGARHGVQAHGDVGVGFEGWCWRNSIAY